MQIVLRGVFGTEAFTKEGSVTVHVELEGGGDAVDQARLHCWRSVLH